MSLTSDEVNYLIWRYLQEAGLEVSAFALYDETAVGEFDEKYKDSIPIGSLVNLVQKGILYAESDQLVKQNGDIQDDKFYSEKFTVFHALNADSGINPPIESKGRFESVEKGDATTNGEPYDNDGDTKRENSPDFIKILKSNYTFEPSTTSDWNPTAPTVLAYGLSDARAKIAVILPNTETKQLILAHPPVSFNPAEDSTSDITTLSWAPMGHLLATAVESGEIRLWAADGKLRNVLYLHHSPIIAIRWSPNAAYILTSDTDNATIVWDTATGNVVQHLDLLRGNETPAATAATTAASTTGITAGLSIPLENVSLGMDASWIDDTKFVVPGLNGSTLVFNIGDRTPSGSLIGHTKSISFIRYNREASLLLTASDDRTIRIWNGTSFNNSQILLGHSQPITFADWISNEFVITCSLDSSIRIWDVRFGKQTSIVVLDGVPILNAEISPDKKHIVVGTTEGIVSVFNIDLLLDDQLKIVAEYQPAVPDADIENNFITSLKWNSSSQSIVVTYSHSESVVLTWDQ